MPVVCIGLSHHSAPLGMRELMAFTPTEQRRFLTAAAGSADAAGFDGLALLATCNRTELYAASDDPGRRFAEPPDALARLLAGARDLSPGVLLPHTYARVGLEAVRHLSRVAAGLDSMVLGESEVLGQVSEARDLARGEGTLGLVLDAAFQTAVRAGRRARAETGISRYATSVSAEAVRLVVEAGMHLSAARVLIVGTGPAGRLAGEALRHRGARDLVVVSRTAGHAETLARQWRAVPLPWHALEAAIRDADVVVTCTGAPHAVITRELVASAWEGRAPGRPLVVADIAVPRDVEPAVRGLRGVTVLDLDDLERNVEGNMSVRKLAAPAAQAIVEEEVSRFEAWRRSSELRPLLSAMRAHGEAIRRGELEKALRHMAPLPPEVRERIDHLTRSLVNKLLHQPSERLRRETDPLRSDTYARAAAELFGLGQAGP